MCVYPLYDTKQLLSRKRSGKLTLSKEQTNEHLKKTYSDLDKEGQWGKL